MTTRAWGILLSFVMTATSMLLGQSPRIAISQDGNLHDKDDICDVGLSTAILAKAGLKSSVVYWGTSDHFWKTNLTWEGWMQTSSMDAAAKFGPFPSCQFFNVRANHNNALNSLVSAINVSSANNLLHILENGPAQLIGQAIAASDSNVRQFVTVYSQSVWNDNHAWNYGASEGLASPYYKYSQFSGMGVNVQHIQEQNMLLSTTKDKFYWLRDSTDPNLQWLYSRNEVAFPLPNTKFDCSGAGLVYYIVTGDQACTPAKLQTFLTQ